MMLNRNGRRLSRSGGVSVSENVDVERGKPSSSSSPSGRERGGGGVSEVARHKVYADFLEWSPDVIHKLLELMHEGAVWPKVTRKIKTVRRQELKRLWAELVSKSQPPTFQKVFGYIKKWLVINESRLKGRTKVLRPPLGYSTCHPCGFIAMNVSQCQRCKKVLPEAGIPFSEDQNSFPKMKGITWKDEIRKKEGKKERKKKKDSCKKMES